MTKEWTFEDLPAPTIELELDFTYSYSPARINCCNDDARPEEEESEITLPDGWEQYVLDCYMIEARKAMKVIEQRLEDMGSDNLPAEWAQEESDSYECDRAEYMADSMRGY